MNLALNPAFLAMFQEAARYYFNIGGRWSGKTHDSIAVVIFRTLSVNRTKVCGMRKVYSSIRETLYADFIAVLDEYNIPYKTKISPLEITLRNGSKIIFKGIDNTEKAKGLSSIDILLIDEANELLEMDFETVDQAIRGKRQENSVYLCMNPVPKVPGSLYWFEKLFRVPEEPGKHQRYYDEDLGSYVCTMRTTYKDNFMCPANVKRRLEGYKKTNPNLYKLWALGQYVDFKGAILRNWDIVPKLPEGAQLLGYGLDFGFSEDPAACVAIYGSKREVWIQGLLYSTDLTNPELYEMIKFAKDKRIVADSAEPKTIKDLFNLGLRGIRGVKKKANYKTEMAKFLQGIKIHLIDGDIDLKREFQTWSWDEDKTGKLLPRPRDGNDHYIDAVIMFMHDYRGPAKMSAGGI